jgi:hypothetical protein
MIIIYLVQQDRPDQVLHQPNNKIIFMDRSIKLEDNIKSLIDKGLIFIN